MTSFQVIYDKFNIRASNAAEIKPGINLFSVKEMLKGQNIPDVMEKGKNKKEDKNRLKKKKISQETTKKDI